MRCAEPAVAPDVGRRALRSRGPALVNDSVRRLMRRLLALFTILAISTVALAEDGRTWAAAVSKQQSTGRAIIFRYVQKFPPSFVQRDFPDRVIIGWRYKSETGMPSASEREQMEQLENLLAPAVEANALSTLALVSTGEGLREWIFYTQSESSFMAKLNESLRAGPRFPIEIHAAADPTWKTYQTFKEGIRE
jgi:hypothetical protein